VSLFGSLRQPIPRQPGMIIMLDLPAAISRALHGRVKHRIRMEHVLRRLPRTP